MKAYLKHGSPKAELRTIGCIMKTCPDYYRASAKGLLTREEPAENSKKCPSI